VNREASEFQRKTNQEPRKAGRRIVKGGIKKEETDV
jgi:hypothetical protein